MNLFSRRHRPPPPKEALGSVPLARIEVIADSLVEVAGQLRATVEDLRRQDAERGMKNDD